MRGPELDWRTFAVALAAAVAACATLWFVAPPRYDTNDDVAIRLNLEGQSVPGQPGTGYVVLSHAALGWTLQSLARAWPAVPWWDLVVAGTLLWALAVVAALVWQALGRDWLSRTAGLAALLIAFVPLVVALQYTIAAIVAGGAALVLLFVELAAAGRPRPLVVTLALALLVVATLLRPMGAIAGAATMAVLLAPVAISGRWRRATRGVLALAAVAALALIVYAGLSSADRWLYRAAPAWDQYARYNDMLARLFEWGGELTADQAARMRAAAGWSANDWELLPGMWGVDPDLHGYDRLRRAFEASDAVGGPSAVAPLLSRAVAVMRSDLARVMAGSSYAIAIAVAIAAAFADRRGLAAIAALLLLYVAVCVGIEAAFKALPFRVMAPIQACLVVAALVTAARFRRQTSPAWQVLAAGVLLAMLAQQTVTVAAGVRAGLRHMAQVDEEVAALWELQPSLVVRHADTFPAEIWWRPFHRPPIDLPSIALGWNNQHPLLQSYLTATGRQPLLATICRDPSILVVADPGRLEAVTSYLRERFREEVTWTRVNEGSFAAWRCGR